jgi:hypothetical protein
MDIRGQVVCKILCTILENPTWHGVAERMDGVGLYNL